MSETTKWLNQINWSDDGLIPVIAQEKRTGKVLTLAWMNREALAKTVEEGRAVYWSRSRKKFWRKGEESGHVQRVTEIRLDCDQDTLLLSVIQEGGIACHTGRHCCFFSKLDNGEWKAVEPVLKDPAQIYRKKMTDLLNELAKILEDRKGQDPATSYAASLYHKGMDAILKKLGEEATETVLAAKTGDRQALIHEVADLWFHSLVLLTHQGIAPEEVLAELRRRLGRSGLEEKPAALNSAYNSF